jgi:hypothetical protein
MWLWQTTVLHHRQELFSNHRNLFTNKGIFFFWVTAPCTLLRINWRFGDTWFATCFTLIPCLVRLRRWRRYVPLKRRSTFNGLRCVISQKTIMFVTVDMRTSDALYPVLGLICVPLDVQEDMFVFKWCAHHDETDFRVKNHSSQTTRHGS